MSTYERDRQWRGRGGSSNLEQLPDHGIIVVICPFDDYILLCVDGNQWIYWKHHDRPHRFAWLATDRPFNDSLKMTALSGPSNLHVYVDREGHCRGPPEPDAPEATGTQGSTAVKRIGHSVSFLLEQKPRTVIIWSISNWSPLRERYKRVC